MGTDTDATEDSVRNSEFIVESSAVKSTVTSLECWNSHFLVSIGPLIER